MTSGEWTRLGPQVAQASGMVAAQAGCSLDAALGLMRQLAHDSDSSLEAVAVAVIERRTRFGGPVSS